MTQAVRLTFLSFLGVLVLFTGCASKQKTQKDLTTLQSQIGSLTDEVVRLDQQLQEVRASVQGKGAPASESGSGAPLKGGIYRTPSGFELPSINIQKALKNAGYYQGVVDGKIGHATQEALKAFQHDQGLDADGVCGRQTWGKLKTYLTEAVK